jgi:hypothetical protein
MEGGTHIMKILAKASIYLTAMIELDVSDTEDALTSAKLIAPIKMADDVLMIGDRREAELEKMLEVLAYQKLLVEASQTVHKRLESVGMMQAIPQAEPEGGAKA